MRKKTFEYSLDKTDDFASVQIRGKGIPSDYVFIHKNPIWRLGAFLFYYFVAVPVLFCFTKLSTDTKVVNKRYIRKKMKNTGFFIYSNHTMNSDAFNHAVITCFPRHTYIVSRSDTLMVSKPLQTLMMMMGAYPLPSDLHSARNFLKGLQYRLDRKAAIVIYPEGKIWPFYTGQRPVGEGAFKYPRAFDKPVVFACTTFRKPRGLFRNHRAPRAVIYLSDPVYPSRNPVEKTDEKRLRDLFQDYIEKMTSIKENYAANTYIPKESGDDLYAESLSKALDEYESQTHNKEEER